MIYRIFYYLFGNVKIQVTGVFVERFINLVSRRGIKIWDISRVGETEALFFMSKKDFKKIRPAARNTGVRVKIADKKGFPFVYDKYKRRYALLGGLLVFFVVLFALSQFVWGFDITGNEKLTSDQILSELAENGVKRGAYKRGLDLAQIINQIHLDVPEISFISINLKGMRAEIQIEEGVPKPQKKTGTPARSIVSKSDGQIVSMEVYEGEGVVQRGDVVQKGDLLVNGAVPLRDENYYIVSSEAKISAHVWKSGTIKADRIATAKIPGNREFCRYSINISGFEIKMFINTRISIPTYDRIEEIDYIELPFGIKTPIFIRRETYKEYFLLSRIQTDAELETLCRNKLTEYINKLELIETYGVTEDMKFSENGGILEFMVDGLMDIVEYQEVAEPENLIGEKE